MGRRRQALHRLRRARGGRRFSATRIRRWCAPSHDVAANGLSFGAPTEIEIEMAETLVPPAAVARARAARVVGHRGDDVGAASRARLHRAQSKIVKFEGCYHGHGDSLLVKAGSGALTFGQPSSAGVPPAIAERNDRAARTTTSLRSRRRSRRDGERHRMRSSSSRSPAT